jgi:predicted small lipoprotein YifL
MSLTPQTFPRCGLAVTLAFALAACGTNEPLKTDMPPPDQRLLDLERRVEKLEARGEVAQPYRSKAEIQAQIKSLEEERSKLLVSYTVQHPAVRDIDRKLVILNNQLNMTE